MMKNGSIEHIIALMLAGFLAIIFAVSGSPQYAMTLISIILGYAFGVYKTTKKG